MPADPHARTDFAPVVTIASELAELKAHIVGLVSEEGGARVAVPITDAADALHGVSVDLPKQSPAEVVIDTRTGRVSALPWE